jgi:hypothetical protein
MGARGLFIPSMNKDATRKVGRGGNEMKGKQCVGVLPATDTRGDVGSTNRCSNCRQISELYPKARRRAQGRRGCVDVRSRKAKVKDGKRAGGLEKKGTHERG